MILKKIMLLGPIQGMAMLNKDEFLRAAEKIEKLGYSCRHIHTAFEENPQLKNDVKSFKRFMALQMLESDEVVTLHNFSDDNEVNQLVLAARLLDYNVTPITTFLINGKNRETTVDQSDPTVH